jgi:hypothetical protein
MKWKNIIILIGIIIAVFFIRTIMQQNNQISDNNPQQEHQETSTPIEGEDIPNHTFMNLTVYVGTDQGATRPIIIQVPQTTAVADASLEWLFENELSQYGSYNSVTINNQVAFVSLKNTNLPGERPFSSLSSAESLHLITTISNTLIQYPSISQVILLDGNDKEIIF